MRLLDNEREPTTVVGWLLGSDRGSFALLLATIAVVLGLLLAGCSPIATAGSVASSPRPFEATADTVVVEGGRALIIANLAYQTAGTAAALAIENGWIKGEAKAKVQAASQKAVDALQAGERAVLTADKASQAAAALSAVGELCAVHPFIKAACDRTK